MSDPGAAIGDRIMGLTFVLPGSWARIPLESTTAAYEEIGRLLKERVPRRDDLAQLKREAREMLRGIADEAMENDVDFLALSLEILPGVPFSASIVAAYRDADESDSSRALVDRLQAVVPDGELIELSSGPAVRSVELTERDEDDAPLDSVDLIYLVPTPDPLRWLQVIADVPTEIDPELVVELFDAIVGSVLWTDLGPALSRPGDRMT